jgi:MerR family copper efflux transcriptional regulator
MLRGMEGNMRAMTIGRLAQEAGVNIDTIRYYERNGLLPEPARKASGYREYTQADVRRLRFVMRAKELGFTLAEIGELLALSATDDVNGVKRRAEARMLEIDRKIAELRRVRRGLKTLVDACPGHGDSRDCPIIAALNDEARR